MNRIMLIVGLLLILISLGFGAPAALAGGWAAVTLDTLPVKPQAGELLRIGFTVRQHGVTPTNTVTPYLEAENTVTGESLRVKARQEGPVGHFVADVVFPSSGTWHWRIGLESLGLFPENFEPLTVLPPAAGALSDSSNPRWWPVGLAAIMLVGLGLAMRRSVIEKKRFFTGGAAFVLVLLGGLLIWPALTSSTTDQASADALLPTAKNGRALYVAKGCLACHMYRGLSSSVPGPVIGPTLSDYAADPAYLRHWLADPQAIKADTRMPKLNLRDDEIEALIAFLSE